jgi:hypothetical protein
MMTYGLGNMEHLQPTFPSTDFVERLPWQEIHEPQA